MLIRKFVYFRQKMVLAPSMVSNRMFECTGFWNDIFYVELMEYLNFEKNNTYGVYNM